MAAGTAEASAHPRLRFDVAEAGALRSMKGTRVELSARWRAAAISSLLCW